jgi:nitronate monooxygenase
MGTRFMCTKEAPVHDNIKQALVNASERDTVLMFRSLHNTARVLKNAVSQRVVALGRRPGGVEFDELRPLVVGTRGREALRAGAVDDGVVSAGMVVGLIDDVPSCAELIERIVQECRQRLRAATAMVEASF